MMAPLNVKRSTIAAQSRGSVNVLVQPEKAWLLAIANAVLLLAFGEDLEQEFGAAAVEFHVAEFVDAEQVDAAVAGDRLRQHLLISGLDEFVHQPGGEGVADTEAFLGGDRRQGDQQVTLSGWPTARRRCSWDRSDPGRLPVAAWRSQTGCPDGSAGRDRRSVTTR